MADSFIEEIDAFLQVKPVDHLKEMELLAQAAKDFPTNVEVLYRYARAYYNQGTETFGDDEGKMKASLEKGLEVAEKAIEVDPSHFGGHKWAGILLGTLGDLLPMKEKIASAFKIKDYFVAAEKICPEDATVQLALGKWCYSVSSIGFLERQAASILFATPPESTFEEALTYVKKSYDIIQSNPEFDTGPQCLLMMGKTYEALKDQDTAKVWYGKVAELTGSSFAIKEAKAEAKKKLDAINSSWW
eukprot:TRINITY_DN8_c0_g1_i1.p1 TRINITY_DN8_c0_g1~~TRINITY_DN8_c0_g1_i1.p1  ORF type:complete len:245 (-),score=80.20 TRINITY_DN8_c0_g1_i1:336-1070(-)